MVFLLIPAIICRFFKINHSCRFMMLIATPKTSSRIPFTKTRMVFKHPLCTPWFQHYLSSLHRVTFWDVHLKVNLIQSKPNFPKLKPKSFEFTKSFCTRINVGLSSKTIKSAFGVKFYGDPVISGVIRNLFSTTTTNIFQKLSNSCCTISGHAPVVCRVQQKKNINWSLKSDTASHLRAFRFTSVHAVFSAVVYKIDYVKFSRILKKCVLSAMIKNA
jgi:hypothetical protein